MSDTNYSIEKGIASRIAVDLRQPVHELVEYLEAIRAGGSIVDRRTLESAWQRAGSVLFRLNNFEDVLRCGEQSLELQHTSFSLREIMRMLGSIINARAHAMRTEFVLSVEDDVPDRLLGDPQRLAQAILNLVENSLVCTREGAIVVYVAAKKNGNTIELHLSAADSAEVRDVDEEISFTTLQEAREFMVGNYPDGGLELAVAYEIIRAMNGTLRIRRVKRQGSAFHFTIQVRRVPLFENAVGPLLDHRPLRPRPLRVLVVDDHRTNRLLLQRIVEREGHAVTTAEDGEDAIRLFVPGAFDIVFMDIQMPNMDGRETSRRLREAESGTGHRCCIIAVSATPPELIWKECDQVGVDDYIGKPLDLKRVQTYLDWYSFGNFLF